MQPLPQPPEDAAIAWRPDSSWAATQMSAADRTKAFLGIAIDELHRGRAILSMRVRPEMANGFGITHGGMVFALADTAFAYACNEGEDVTVASGVDVTFTRASHEGDRLTATAVKRWAQGRNGLYDVTVADQHGDVIVEFRGRSFATNRPLPAMGDCLPPGTSVAPTKEHTK